MYRGGNGEIITSARTNNVCGDNQKWINTFLMRPGQTESLLCNYALFAQLYQGPPFLFIMVIALLFELPDEWTC